MKTKELSKTILKRNINMLTKRGNSLRAELLYFKVLGSVLRTKKITVNLLLVTIGNNLRPLVGLLSRKVGSSTYRIPVSLSLHKERSLGFFWMSNKISIRKSVNIASGLHNELTLAYKKKGLIFKKRNNIHELAKHNRAYLKYII